jgi:hypothetical protein
MHNTDVGIHAHVKNIITRRRRRPKLNSVIVCLSLLFARIHVLLFLSLFVTDKFIKSLLSTLPSVETRFKISLRCVCGSPQPTLSTPNAHLITAPLRDSRKPVFVNSGMSVVTPLTSETNTEIPCPPHFFCAVRYRAFVYATWKSGLTSSGVFRKGGWPEYFMTIF